ncbi:elongation factor P maturation arginine rhamnosyltransferase EarP, partial [Klebsiella pneumoniae]
AAQRQFLQTLGVFPDDGARLISLFAYENAGLAGWLDVLSTDGRATHLLVPEGRVLGDVARWLGLEGLVAGDIHQRDALT